MNIGKYGVWFFLDGMTAPETAAYAQKVEKLGYSALWIPEAVGREPFPHAAYLLAKTQKLILATGIANIWARDPMTMSAAAQTLAEISDCRFVLGIGVSHAPLVERLRGHDYKKPYSYMKEYLAKTKAAMTEPAMYQSVKATALPPILLAALHPKMLQLAATEAQGTHTYFVPPEHTAKARAAIGKDAWICVAQATILETDPAVARKAARSYMKTYVPRLPNYTLNLRLLGWKDADFENGCSDALVDAIVAWGSADQIRTRIEAHHQAGATHVCILPLRADGKPTPCERGTEALAPR